LSPKVGGVALDFDSKFWGIEAIDQKLEQTFKLMYHYSDTGRRGILYSSRCFTTLSVNRECRRRFRTRVRVKGQQFDCYKVWLTRAGFRGAGGPRAPGLPLTGGLPPNPSIYENPVIR